MKKQFIAGCICGALLFGTVGVFAGQYIADTNPYPIKLNGNDVSMEGYNIEGYTYFKLRDIADVVGGFDVDFQNDTIQLSKDGYVYTVPTTQNFVDITSEISISDFMKYTGFAGYEKVSEYSIYNTYASVNGLADKMIYVQGYISEVFVTETNISAILESYDNPDEKWLIGLSDTKYSSYQTLKDVFEDKYVSIAGKYLGYSDRRNLPGMSFEFANVYGGAAYTFSDFIQTAP